MTKTLVGAKVWGQQDAVCPDICGIPPAVACGDKGSALGNGVEPVQTRGFLQLRSSENVVMRVFLSQRVWVTSAWMIRF